MSDSVRSGSPNKRLRQTKLSFFVKATKASSVAIDTYQLSVADESHGELRT
jgi:hypothetical protein